MAWLGGPSPGRICASKAKSIRTGSCLFVITALAAESPRKNAFVYGELASGRTFIESDPVGLHGGINTYAYGYDNPLTFPTIQAAAVDALNWVYLTYPNANFEYAGTIYQDSDGQYVASNPNSQPSAVNTVQPSYGPGLYAGVQAYYHTHGKCLKGFDNDHFSHGYPQSDLQQADWHLPNAVPSFLQTPGRIILEYTPDPNRDQWNGDYSHHIATIQPGKPCPCNATQK